MKILVGASQRALFSELPASVACVVIAAMIFVFKGFELGACIPYPQFGSQWTEYCPLPNAAMWPLIAGAVIFPMITRMFRSYGLDPFNNSLLLLIGSGFVTALLLPLVLPTIMPDTFLAGIIAALVFVSAKNAYLSRVSEVPEREEREKTKE
ncbi:MAG: hypothetical protein AAFR71_07075 [Pseudomonadota bacterium]